FVVAAAFTSTLPRAWQRMFVLLCLGCITVAVTAATFPQCLAGPYAALDQVLPGYFDTIAEAQPLWIRAFTDPPTAVAFALTTLLALPVTAWQAWRGRGESRVDWLILLGFLAGGALVMVMQLRGARLAAPFALPASAYVFSWRAGSTSQIPVLPGRRRYSGAGCSSLGSRTTQSSAPRSAGSVRAQRRRAAFPLPSPGDRKSTRLNSSHVKISYAVFCLIKKISKHRSEQH